MVRIVVKEAQKAPVVKEIEGTLEAMQNVVDGRIEQVPFMGITIILNEEGKFIEGLLPNIKLGYHRDGVFTLTDVAVGTIFATEANDEGEQRSLTDEEVEKAIEVFTKFAI